MTERRADGMSIVAVLGGFGLAFGLWVAVFSASISCSLLGEQCTLAELQEIRLLELSSIGAFLVVPVVVATVRRQARWLLAPVIEAALIAGVIIALDWW